MDSSWLDFIIDTANERRFNIIHQRSKEYASEEDVLANFKRVAEICDILGVNVRKPSGCILYMKIHKLDRLCNMFYDKVNPTITPTIQDTLDDDRNYTDLLEAILMGERIIEQVIAT